MIEPPTNALHAQRIRLGISQSCSLLKPAHHSNSSKFRIIPKYSAFPVQFLPWKTAMSNQKWGRCLLSQLHFCLPFGCSMWADLGAHVTVFTSRLKRMNSSSVICKSHYHMPPESSCVAAAASPASVCLALGTKARAHLPETDLVSAQLFVPHCHQDVYRPAVLAVLVSLSYLGRKSVLPHGPGWSRQFG